MKNRLIRITTCVTIVTPLLFIAAISAQANTCTVTSTADSGPGTLRGCLATAADGDTIDATGVSGTILLISGELQIIHNVTINGPGAASLVVNGNATFRVFENFGSTVTISGLTVTNGFDATGNGGGGILNEGGLTLRNSIISNSASLVGNDNGGGLNNSSGATLAVTNSTISGNSAGNNGGGIFSTNATLTVTNSTLSGNSAGTGGGIFYNGGGTLTVINSILSGNSAVSAGGGMGSGLQGTTIATVRDSTISGNSSGGNGGGIFNYPQTLTVISSTISGNSAGQDGGGIWTAGNPESLTVTNSTISGNSASSSGGGIWNDAQNNGSTVNNSTLSGNSAPTGGDIFNQGGATTTIGDTVLNAGASGGTISNNGGTVTSLGYNLASDDGGGVLTGPGDQINTDPLLGPLKDNGGPTATYAPLTGSPAIDKGKDIGATGQDQRGDVRPVRFDPSIPEPPGGDGSDIGAVELAVGVIPTSAASRKTHGSAGTFDINLPVSGNVGIECRSGGVNNDYQMIVNFAQPVTFSSAAITEGTGSVASSSGSGTTQVIVNLTGVANAQRITVAVFDVNDGTHSGDVGVRMGVLVGDVNGNAVVNASDVSLAG